jgi:hypothetical protein
VRNCGPDSCGLGKGTSAGSCEHVNKSLGSKKAENFLTS